MSSGDLIPNDNDRRHRRSPPLRCRLRSQIRCGRATTGHIPSSTTRWLNSSHCPAARLMCALPYRLPEDAEPYDPAERTFPDRCAYRGQDCPRILNRGRRQEAGGRRYTGDPERFRPVSSLAAARSPDMYELHSEDPALELMPGRCALILKEPGL